MAVNSLLAKITILKKPANWMHLTKAPQSLAISIAFKIARLPGVPKNLKSGTVRITGIPKDPQFFFVGHSDGRLGKQVATFNRHTKILVGKFGQITDPKVGGI